MKKLILTVGAGLLMALNSHATLILSNSFGYADGPLVANSTGSPLGVWKNHSGTASQVDVSSGVVNLTQAESEDVNTVITNATFPVPFTNQILYAGFKVNFSLLPSGAGGYFAHFKDDTTSNFRCRVFATTNGAAVGKYRLGIQTFSGPGPVYIATDLDLFTEYKMVVQFKGSTNSVLWINPITETSTGNRADATDTTSNTYKGSSTFALRQSLNSGDGMGTLTFDDLLIGTAFLDVHTPPANPSIGGIANVSIPANSSAGPLAFIVEDGQTPAASLTVTAVSDNTALIPNANCVFGGSGNNRTITVTPTASAQGVANITVTVTDGDLNTSSTTFKVTVGAPTISAIPNQIAVTNTITGPVAFTVNDLESSPGGLSVTATSSDQIILPDANIGIQNLGGQNRTITLTNLAPGLVTVTVTVHDGTHDIPTTFLLTAYQNLGVVLGDTFTYSNGALTNSGTGFWGLHSGTNGVEVVNGKVLMSGTNSADVSAFLTNFPFAASGPNSGFVFYSRFIVNYGTLPSGNGGDYFAHFRDTGTTFRARVFGLTNGAAAGKYRIGISSGGFTTTGFPTDLSLNTDHVVITRYNLSTGESTLWVDPASESSPSLAATDTVTPTTIYTYSLRENAGIGTLTLDDLIVGSSFSDVFVSLAPNPEPLKIAVSGANVLLTWTNAAFKLQASPLVNGTYTNVPSAASPHPYPIGGEQKYFRLIYP